MKNMFATLKDMKIAQKMIKNENCNDMYFLFYVARPYHKC